MFWVLSSIIITSLMLSALSTSSLGWKGTPWEGFVFGLNEDFLSNVFILVVLIIVFHAFLLTSLYMGEETNFSGFVLTTFLFAASIFILVSSDSISSLFLGWDGLGVSSFFLVIWYQTWSSLDSGIITFLSNRFGDFFLIFSLIGLLSLGTLKSNPVLISGFSLILIVACFTNSAQVPFNVWLPMAISAPTPISALVHSSTLVTAGLFIAINFSSFLLAETFLILGIITILIAGAISLFELDLNNVVALSTLSQLGLIGLGLGSGALCLSFFHIISHALVNSALFLLIGSALHGNYGSQDNRLLRVSSAEQQLCLTGLSLCSFSLCGLGFTSGFTSKEALLLQISLPNSSVFLSFSGILVVSFTFIYCGRILSSSIQSFGQSTASLNESSKFISSISLLLLLGVSSAWCLSESLFHLSSINPSTEIWLPLLILIFSLNIWILQTNWNFLFSSLGWSLFFSLLTNVHLNISNNDREVVDQGNLTSLGWTDTNWLISNSGSNGTYHILYLLTFIF